jgi:hypothetical protein
MSFRYSRLAIAGAALVVLAGVPACSKSDAPKPTPTSQASTTEADTSTSSTATSTTAAGKPETVVFEVSGSGTATTIDLVPSGADRLYSVALPWTETITITPDVKQLQIVVVGGSDPGCKITLDEKVVAEQPAGGSAHCVFDR